MVVVTLLGPCLRTLDNPALASALRERPDGESVVACYLEDPTQRLPGAAYTWWTRKSLPLLRQQLDRLHVPLVCLRGSLPHIARVLVGLPARTTTSRVSRVYVNRRWGGTTAEQDEQFDAALHEHDIPVNKFTAHTLHDPWEIKTGQGGYYRVYTPFSKQFAQVKPRLIDEPPAQPHEPHAHDSIVAALEKEHDIEVLDWAAPAAPYNPPWAQSFTWKPGAEEAQKTLDAFLAKNVADYAEGRNLPFSHGTSQLSPYLAHGEISPHRVLDATRKAKAQLQSSKDKSGAESAFQFEREIIWREFQYHILYHEPYIGWGNHNTKFDNFPWATPLSDKEVRDALGNARPDDALERALEARAALECWKSGHTGIPIVDAGMRQLWTMGWMHNRVRMIVASFLTKNLHHHWRVGEAWFWDALVDADPASNPGNWQWVAGTGADAAPYFRVFNPVRQAQRFDETCAYVRQWVPELKSDSTKAIMGLYEREACSGTCLLEHPSPMSLWPKKLSFLLQDDTKPAIKAEDGAAAPDAGQLITLRNVATPEKAYRRPIANLKTTKDEALSYFQMYGKSDKGPKKEASDTEDEPPKKAARRS